MELTNKNEWYRLGETYLGNSLGDLYIRIYARWTSQDENNLTSIVQYQARAYYNGNYYIRDQGSYGSVSGTGASTGNFSRYDDYPSGETLLKTIEGTISHDPNTGAASVSGSATLYFPNWGWSGTASGTATLPTIDVATLHLRVNNQWVKATPYLGVNGSWQKCKAYLGVNGNWTKGV